MGRRANAPSDLPAGSKLGVSVTTKSTKDDGSTVSIVSDVLSVDLEAVPTPTQFVHDVDYKFVLLTPTPSEKAFGAEVKLYANVHPADAHPAGLYLSRVYFTKSATDSSGATLSAGKAIVLSNASFSPITLNGSYTLRVRSTASDGTTKDSVWDFAVAGEDPITIGAWQEVAFYCERQGAVAPVDLPEDAFATNVNALYYITDSKTVALYRGETCINALCPASNAVVRLKPGSLESETFAVGASDDELPALTYPWVSAPAPQVLYSVRKSSASDVMIAYSRYVDNVSDAYKIWAEAVFIEGTSRSAPATVILKSASVGGFRLLLR